MNFEVREEFRQLHASVRDFVKNTLDPISLKVEKEETIPEEVVDAIRNLACSACRSPKNTEGWG